MIDRHGWILLGLAAAVAILVEPPRCEAAARGLCAECHTMHNSQQGSPVAFVLDSSGQKVMQGAAFKKLLKTNCIGCHTNAGAETIIPLGENQVPIVFNLTQPTYPPSGSTSSALAGGNFYWVIQNNQHGHNVHGIAGQDPRFSWAPGGVQRAPECNNCHGTLATPESGCNGCHAAYHHADGKGEVAGPAEGWFRFLGSVMQKDDTTTPPLTGVSGIEDPSWEQNPLATRHNAYKGKPGPYTSYLESGSITQKCIGCHGRFHSETIANATWIRHPADAVIPDSGEFTGLIGYDPMVPVARQNITSLDANFSTVNRGSDVVACISCHRAHGSPYPSSLRWAYRAWPGIDPQTGQPAMNGCAVCHTTKD